MSFLFEQFQNNFDSANNNAKIDVQWLLIFDSRSSSSNFEISIVAV